MVWANFWIFFKCLSEKLHCTVDSNPFYAIKCSLLNVCLNKSWQICTSVHPQLQSRYRIFPCCNNFPNAPSPVNAQPLAPGNLRAALWDCSSTVSICGSHLILEVGYLFICLSAISLYYYFFYFRERETLICEKHQSAASCTFPDWGTKPPT